MARPKKTVEPTTNEKLSDALVSLQNASLSMGDRDNKLYVLSEGQYTHIINTLQEVLGEE
tara:strand:- start:291 stop:470 length:180 start_codon:yes stop_codon:yes gene_type:complete